MSDSQEQFFDANLELHPTDGGVFLFVPFNVPEVFGQRGHHVLTVNKQLRNTIGKTWGMPVHVTMRADTDEPGFVVPEDLARALDRVGLRAKFDQLAYPYRREYVQWVERAKKPEARLRRIQDVLEGAQAGRKPK
jgi:hypothetical protein